MKISATEAKKISDRNARAIAIKNKQQARLAEKTRLANEQKAREKYYKDLIEQIDRRIVYTTKDGKTQTRVSIVSGYDSPVDAQKGFNEHKYLSLIKKAMQHFEKLGYTVVTGQECSEHTTMHESSVPDRTYYKYSMYLQLSW